MPPVSSGSQQSGASTSDETTVPSEEVNSCLLFARQAVAYGNGTAVYMTGSLPQQCNTILAGAGQPWLVS